MLVIVIAPVILLATVGAKPAVSVALCPGANVVLPLIPVALTPAPLTVSPEIVRLEFPVFVSFSTRVVDQPRVIFPNARLPGETPNSRVVAIPVPLTAIDNELSDAVDPIVTAPLALPARDGWKTIVNSTDAPAPSQYGAAIPDTEKPPPVAVAPEIETARVPVFFS